MGPTRGWRRQSDHGDGDCLGIMHGGFAPILSAPILPLLLVGHFPIHLTPPMHPGHCILTKTGA